jgi:hypothetical protein
MAYGESLAAVTSRLDSPGSIATGNDVRGVVGPQRRDHVLCCDFRGFSPDESAARPMSLGRCYSIDRVLPDNLAWLTMVRGGATPFTVWAATSIPRLVNGSPPAIRYCSFAK